MSTRLQLLRSAERLFAVHGIAEVSLRQIGADAGQRNTAAAHYHFGDKQTLLREVLRARLDTVDARRRELLAAVPAEPGDDVRPLVEALVLPLAAQAVEPGSHYVRFLDRLFAHLDHEVTALARIGGFEQAFATARIVVERLPRLTGPLAAARARWAGRLIISALADLEAEQQTAPGDPEPYTTCLVDAVTGLLTR
ncbi:TetR/AcrR family transcriptional regulator [Streptacidiphilus rugosus]|uniref:TetR/AcrR family transcriptional regulator n=1 Tax=Streptacidiphilus rugosus TaxID=405783 RepID=UPI0009FFEDC6|nr:TetR family transcriptional regulator [Streptacidiphilus rugosus]